MQLTLCELWRASLGGFFVARQICHADDAFYASHGFCALAIKLVRCTGDRGDACCSKNKYCGEHHDDLLLVFLYCKRCVKSEEGGGGWGQM